MTTALSPDVVAEIVRRLAHAFPIAGCSFGPDELVDEHSIGNLLCGIDADERDEVGMLFRMGVLKESSRPGSAEPAELLRFLEEYGQVWYLARLEMVRTALRKSVAGDVEPES